VVIIGAAAAGVFLSRPKTVAAGASHRTEGTTAGTTAPKPISGAVGTGYLAKASDGIIFIQWTRSGNSLSGTAQDEYLSGSTPNETVKSDTITVSGQLNGPTITLSFDDGASVFGTLSGGSFTVNFPQNDGSLAPLTFSSASASQFNEALANLQGTTGNADQREAEAETVTSEQQSIANDVSTVNGDISDLQGYASGFASDYGGFVQALDQAKTDLGTTAQAEQSVITESQNGTTPSYQVCSDADSVAADADSVDADGDSVSAAADAFENDLTSARGGVSGIQQDFSTLQSAESQLPSYQDNAPTQGEVDQAIASAQAAISSALNTANGYISQVNGIQTQAYNDAVAAAQAGNCNAPNPSNPQPSIS
jgi:hypothetical protein